MRVVHILPTYNEKENIELMLKTLLKISKETKNHNFQILVVDDNSPDGTAGIVKEYARKNPLIHLLTGPKRGLGFALIRGYKYAMKDLGAEVVIPNDCDFSFDPQKVPLLLSKIEEGFDVVVASRHVGKGKVKRWSLFRKLNHWVSNVLFASWVAGIKEVKDHNGNFKAIRVKGVLEKVPLDRLKIRGFAFQPVILYELSKVTDKFCEVPVVFKFRKRGEAKIGMKYLKNYLCDVAEYIKLSFLIRLERSAQFLKFCVVGTIGFVINSLGLETFYNFGLRPNLAAALGAELAIISNFTLNNIWTFKKYKIKNFVEILTKFFQFNLTSAGAVIIQFIVVGIGTFLTSDDWRQIWLVISILFFIIPYNYFMYTRFIWKAQSSKVKCQN